MNQLNNIFERIVKDKNGNLALVRFTIVDGKGQIVSIEPVNKTEILCLPCTKNNKIMSEKSYIILASTISPYFSLEFLMSQPTRAPSFVY